MIKKSLLIVMASCILLIANTALAVPVSGYSEDWDVSGDLAGWGQNTTQTNVAVVDVGGNPGGYLYSYGDVSGSFDIGANYSGTELTGDYSGNIWQVSFDLNFIRGNFDDAWLRYRYQDSSHNGWKYDLSDVFEPGWNSYSVTFDASWTDAQALAMGWSQEPTSPSFADTMGNVYTTEIRISGEGLLAAGIDNFQLNTASVPEPLSLVLLALGIIGLGLSRRVKRN